MEDHKTSLTLLPDSAQRLSNLCGHLNEHIKQIESGLSLNIQQRGNTFLFSGTTDATKSGCCILESLYKSTESGSLIHPKMVHLAIHEAQQSEAEVNNPTSKGTSLIRTSKASVKPRGEHQQLYVKNIHCLLYTSPSPRDS